MCSESRGNYLLTGFRSISLNLCLSLLVFFFGCHYRIPDKALDSIENKDVPSWVSQRRDVRYPDLSYLIGVGVSDKDRSAADENARIDLVKQIEVELSGEETSFQFEASEKGEGHYTVSEGSNVKSTITSKVDIKMTGLTISERWYDEKEKMFYSLAVLNREAASNGLGRDIDNETAVINDLFSSGQRFEDDRVFSRAIDKYKEAYDHRVRLDALLERYHLIRKGVSEKESEKRDNIWKDLENAESGKQDAGIIKEIKSVSAIREIIDRLSMQISSDTKEYSWNEGIQFLTEQVISGVYEEGIIKVAVLDFVEARSGDRRILSRIIESDLKTTMTKAKDIQVIDTGESGENKKNTAERAKELSADFYLSGIYWHDDNSGLRINARMVDTKKETVISTGRVVLKKDSYNIFDLKEKGIEPRTNDGQGTYDLLVDKLYFSEEDDRRFNIDIWTDKKGYIIGDTLTIYFQSDKDCYVSLLDIGTSGKMTLLFPNSFYKDNFIKGGKTYSIPGDFFGFRINVSGPAGIERIKVIATPEPFPLAEGNTSHGFYSFDREDKKGLRDLSVVSDNLSSKSWAQDYVEIRIYEKSEDRIKKSRSIMAIPPEEPQVPIDIIGVPGRK